MSSKFFGDICIHTTCNMDLIDFEKDLYVIIVIFNIILAKAILLLLFTLLMSSVNLKECSSKGDRASLVS